MSYKSAYSQKLRDPRWQKKRLEVMQAADFCCEICGDSDSTLNVHHKQYLKGYEPWDYSIKQLSCICENCHDEFHKKDDSLNKFISYAILSGRGDRDDCAYLIAGLIGVENIVFDDWHYECNYLIGKLIYDKGNDWVFNTLVKGLKNG